MKWEWFFPAKSTIDVGRESDASINEIHAGINTGARVAADDGFDIEEIKIQRGREIEAEIEVAQEVATSVSSGGQPVMWQEVYQLIYPRPGKAAVQWAAAVFRPVATVAVTVNGRVATVQERQAVTVAVTVNHGNGRSC